MTKLLPEIEAMLTDDRPGDLGPGAANVAVRPALEELARTLPKKARDGDFAAACLAGLWLYHDFLDESHAISQDLHTAEGSYWHALMHRREPDYWNSKYWFRRVGQHPIFGDLREAGVRMSLEQGPAYEFLVRQAAWDPFAFVDLCESAARTHGEAERLCLQIQCCEYDLLFRYCHERAFGG